MNNNNNNTILLALFLIISTFYVGHSSCKQVKYIAAVVDHHALFNANPNITYDQALKVMEENLDAYQEHIVNAASQNAQIIVFPEDGLYGAAFSTRDQVLPFLEDIPDVNQTSHMIVNPCIDPSLKNVPVLKRLSCMAMKYNIVVVANMGDVKYCNPNNSSGQCPQDGRWQFNTDVVLDENGYLIAKYHKSHLYYEPQWNTPSPLQTVSFTTSWGVTFGIMICFDIMFSQPQNALLSSGITDFVFTTWWVNVPPVITGTQVQQAFSYATSSNLLASGAGQNWYNSGSGIYQSGTIIETFYNPTYNSDEVLLVGAVVSNNAKESPLNEEKENAKTILKGVDFKQVQRKLQNPPTFIATPGLKGTLNIFDGDLFCNVTYEISVNSPSTNEVYGLIILNGNYNNLFNAQVCALIRCDNTSSCGNSQFNATTIFSRFSLNGNFPDSQRVYPMVSMNNAQLPSNGKYTVNKWGVQSNNYDDTLLNLTIFGLVWGN